MDPVQTIQAEETDTVVSMSAHDDSFKDSGVLKSVENTEMVGENTSEELEASPKKKEIENISAQSLLRNNDEDCEEASSRKCLSSIQAPIRSAITNTVMSNGSPMKDIKSIMKNTIMPFVISPLEDGDDNNNLKASRAKSPVRYLKSPPPSSNSNMLLSKTSYEAWLSSFTQPKPATPPRPSHRNSPKPKSVKCLGTPTKPTPTKVKAQAPHPTTNPVPPMGYYMPGMMPGMYPSMMPGMFPAAASMSFPPMVSSLSSHAPAPAHAMTAVPTLSHEDDDTPLDLTSSSKRKSEPEDISHNEDEPINLTAKRVKSEETVSTPSAYPMGSSNWYTQALSAMATGQAQPSNPLMAATAQGFNPMMMNPAMMMMNPAMMVNPALMFGSAYQNPSMSGSLTDLVNYDHQVLLADFMETLKRKDSAYVHKMQETYMKEVARVEMERQKSLKDQVCITQPQKDAVNLVNDQQRLQLSKYVSYQLSIEKAKLLGHNSSSGQSSTSIPTPSKVTPPSTSSQKHQISPIAMSSPFQKMFLSPPGGNTSCESGFLEQTGGGSDSSPTNDDADSSGEKKFLCSSAVDVLHEWYNSNRDHPYADDETCKDLAERASITTSQVRKWLSNKRLRMGNTLPFNGTMHPKKLQKLIQKKEEYAAMAGVPSDRLALSLPVSPTRALPSPSKSFTPSPSGKQRQRRERAKRLLDPFAVDLMCQWYQEHIDYPYPTDGEKKELAMKSGITVSQVTCWFANKRNRSNNTKKISPSQMLDRLNKKLARFSELPSNESFESSPVVPLQQITHPQTALEGHS